MMKLIKPVFILVVSFMCASAGAADYTFVAGDKRPETKICMAAVQNDVNGYRKEVRSFTRSSSMSSQFWHRKIAQNLKCNNQKIGLFAKRHGADETMKFIFRYMKKKVIVTRDVGEITLPNNHQLPDVMQVVVVVAN